MMELNLTHVYKNGSQMMAVNMAGKITVQC